jgi:signal peptidase I
VTEAQETKQRGHRSGWLFVRDVVIVLVAAVLISIVVKAFVIRSFYIPSGSMENTLQVQDRIVVDELVPKVIPVQHGDVVVFQDPGGWLTGETAVAPPRPTGFAGAVDWVLTVVGLSTTDSDDHLVKRVIGLPGDHVSCCNAFGQVSVNGIPLSEPYILPEALTDQPSQYTFSVTVPKDSLWVMGDNRGDSRDSRFNLDGPTKGFVPYKDVVGRAFVITWPASHWTWLDDYPHVFDGVTGR